MIFEVLTIFPAFFESPLKESILGKAISKGLIYVRIHNIRDYATDRHRRVDDRPFGGGAGMVMKPEPIVSAIEALKEYQPQPRVILLTPKGKVFNQKLARLWSQEKRLILICGRYEGIDERVSYFVDEEVSIGDYVLSGGEPAAIVIIDAVSRLIPGVLGNEISRDTESFERGLIEHPHYTRPRSFRGYEVPEVLLSGNHEAIRKWRLLQSLILTRTRRPDLFAGLELSEEEKELLEKLEKGHFSP